MRQLNEVVHRLRWGELDERRRRGLVRLHEVLSGTPFAERYWMMHGLLLGCIRDGAPAAREREAHFGFLGPDLPVFLAAVRKLRADGFDLRAPQVNNDGRTTLWTLKREGLKYGFFLCERVGANLRWYRHKRKPPTELVNEVPAHGLTPLTLYGRRWLVPDNAGDVLARIYGDWRNPNPGFAYWRDCGAIVERYPWTGERRPPD